jgi:uncharacterized membrane protein
MKMPLNLRPVTAFVALSVFFGSAVIVATPPLRGPDETAHFLRAYGAALGDIIPSRRDGDDRKGVLLPPRLYNGFEFFESLRVKEKQAGFNYRGVFEAYFGRTPSKADRPASFVPYAGSEGYSPIAYLPQIAAALAARAMDLGFLATLYLMRFAGLAVFTGVIACAIAIVPQLAWAYLAIAMLPAALYGRSVINADGSALAAAMMVTALWLRSVLSPQITMAARQSLWLTLGALTKAPNIAFVLLELRLPSRPRRWRQLGLTVLPPIAAAAVWTFASGADTAAWRMVEITGRDPNAFNPLAKLADMIEHPVRFPAAVFNALGEHGAGDLWLQLIGVLGLFDTVLAPWVYPAVSVLLAASFLARLPLTAADRVRVPMLAAVTALAYILVVYLVSYLVFTPRDASTVWGVQGRYFVPILSLVAIMVAAAVNHGPSDRVSAMAAVSLAVLSGCACLEAILRVDWLNT